VRSADTTSVREGIGGLAFAHNRRLAVCMPSIVPILFFTPVFTLQTQNFYVCALSYIQLTN
jgi:hypothetical protein